jgi:RNA polymerase sigma-70 factor, ECF subfamily
MSARACLLPTRFQTPPRRPTLHGVPVRWQRPGGVVTAAWADNPTLDVPAAVLGQPTAVVAEVAPQPTAEPAATVATVTAEPERAPEPTPAASGTPDTTAVSSRTEIDGEDVRVLINRARAGDSAAFGRLYQRYQRTVYGFIYRRVNNPTVAEDLTSEVFVRALRKISGFTWQGRDPVAWLVTIAANLVRDHFRSARQRLEVVSDDAVAGQHRRAQSTEGQPELAAIAAMTNEALREAIAKLTPAQQQCIALRFFAGLNTRETAERMGTTARAVVSMQYRAVQALADTMPARAVTG